jgi:hypothetical protein
VLSSPNPQGEDLLSESAHVPPGAPVLTGERPGDVLGALSSVVHGRLAAEPVGDATDSGWVGLDEVLLEPLAIGPLVRSAQERFRSDDWALVLAQIARESISVLVTAGVDLWCRHRRLFDMSAANVVLRDGPSSVQVGLRCGTLAVLADDPLAPLASPALAPLAGSGAGGDGCGVVVINKAQMLQRLLDQGIGRSVPAGSVPAGAPDRVASVATIIATVRRTVRSGHRHLWGTAGLAVASSLASASHVVGDRADRDRDLIFTVRRDLARTVRLTTADDGLGGSVTFGLRRTCCLLLKLPDGGQCGTCSLRDHDTCAARLTEWHRTERRRIRETL